MKTAIQNYTSCPWKDQILWYDTIDSTNTQAKKLAAESAPHGTIVIADHQSAGRGRMGRQFDSQAAAGIYMSVILRPQCTPDNLMHLTCAAGIAMCDAVEKATGLRPSIKWINDLVYEGRKLGGILTELSVDPSSGMTVYAIIGIGINCNRDIAEFPPALQDIATSLSVITEKPIDRVLVVSAMIDALYKMDQMLENKIQVMHQYRRDCITLNKDVILHGDIVKQGKALDIDPDGALIVQLTDGATVAVNSGEVSVRGLYGYI